MTLLPLAEKCHGRPSAEPAGQGYNDLVESPVRLLSTITRVSGRLIPCHGAHVMLPIPMAFAWDGMLPLHQGTGKPPYAK